MVEVEVGVVGVEVTELGSVCGVSTGCSKEGAVIEVEVGIVAVPVGGGRVKLREETVVAVVTGWSVVETTRLRRVVEFYQQRRPPVNKSIFISSDLPLALTTIPPPSTLSPTASTPSCLLLKPPSRPPTTPNPTSPPPAVTAASPDATVGLPWTICTRPSELKSKMRREIVHVV